MASETRIYFAVKKPGKTHRSFKILRQEKRGSRSSFQTEESEALDTVNRHYLSGTFSFDQAYSQALAIRDNLAKSHGKRKAKPITLAENHAILEKYWRQEYSHRDIRDAYSMRKSLERALAKIGPLALATVSQDELQAAVAEACADPSDQRRMASRLNQLLKFIGRPWRLKLKKRKYIAPRHLTLSEVRAVASHVGGAIGDLILVAFGTGLRAGEIFALEQRNLRGKDALFISRQMLSDGAFGPTKNDKDRTTLVIAEAGAALSSWIALPMADRKKLRNLRHSDIVRRACAALWPGDPAKHCTFHDLRHSYAIHMLNLGVPLDKVAMLLGDSIQVTQMYYTGFALTDEGLDAVRRIVEA